MFDDEARLIERLGAYYPQWRTVSDDPYAAAEILKVRLPRVRPESIVDDVEGVDETETED